MLPPLPDWQAASGLLLHALRLEDGHFLAFRSGRVQTFQAELKHGNSNARQMDSVRLPADSQQHRKYVIQLPLLWRLRTGVDSCDML